MTSEQITDLGSTELTTTELISQGVFAELAEAAKRHNVMISITVTPYSEEAAES
jgi:hypothetical protein